MRDEDITEAENDPDHDGGIYTAVRAWISDPAAAKARYGPIASWDTSGITDMSELFYEKEDCNEDISRWNVSNVFSMDHTFQFAASFTGDLSRWEVGQVESMNSMFWGAISFNGDLSNWDVGEVESMRCMFGQATSFNGDLSLALNPSDTRAESTRAGFCGCSAPAPAPMSLWIGGYI